MGAHCSQGTRKGKSAKPVALAGRSRVRRRHRATATHERLVLGYGRSRSVPQNNANMALA